MTLLLVLALLPFGCRPRIEKEIADQSAFRRAPTTDEMKGSGLVIDAAIMEVQVLDHEVLENCRSLAIGEHWETWRLALHFNVLAVYRGGLADKKLALEDTEFRWSRAFPVALPDRSIYRKPNGFWPVAAHPGSWKFRMFFSGSSPRWSRRVRIVSWERPGGLFDDMTGDEPRSTPEQEKGTP
jgi:hypothetical protein